MTIRFVCSNRMCQKPMLAPDGSQGRKAKCPLCGSVQPVPDLMDKELVPLAGEDLPPSRDPAENDSPAVRYAPPDDGELSGFAVNCFSAINYPFGNLRSIVRLVLYSAMPTAMTLFGISSGFPILGIIGFALLVIMSGYFLQFFLDCVLASLEGSDDAPNVPDFSLSILFATGLRGLGLWLLYVLPVITIPLLPMALLILGSTGDNRAFNVLSTARAVKAAGKRYIALWGFWILWGSAMVTVTGIVIYSLGLLLHQLTGSFVFYFITLAFLAMAVTVIVGVLSAFATVIFRCLGILGRYEPRIFDRLTDQDDLATTTLWMAGGVVTSALVWSAVIYILE